MHEGPADPASATLALALQQIREIEEAAADAVPPAITEALDGWRLRFNHGVKRRPNSVLANAHTGALDLEEKVRRAEGFYRAHGLKARFQLSPASSPPQLNDFLEARGYLRASEAVKVQIAALTGHGTVGPTETLTRTLHTTTRTEHLDHPAKSWTELYCEVEGLTGVQADALRTMLTRLPSQSAFILAYDSAGQPAATALGVAHRELLGIFNVATSPRARRQGLASAATRALLDWGTTRGMSRAYLQVSEANGAAQAVYGRLGFRTLYSYYYLEVP